MLTDCLTILVATGWLHYTNACGNHRGVVRINGLVLMYWDKQWKGISIWTVEFLITVNVIKIPNKLTDREHNI